MNKMPLFPIPVAPVTRTEYVFEDAEERTVDELAAAAARGEADAVAHHYASGPILSSVMARGVRTMEDMRALAGL